MVEVADIFRLHGPDYQAKFADRMLPSHRRAMEDIVTGGGLTEDGKWNSSRPDFLLPVKALSPIFRAKFRDQLKKTELFNQVDERVWAKAWVVHSEPVGSGQAAFKYLAPYVFRVAISNNRILELEDGQVTFKYKESATDQIKFCTVPAEEFIRRFL